MTRQLEMEKSGFDPKDTFPDEQIALMRSMVPAGNPRTLEHRRNMSLAAKRKYKQRRKDEQNKQKERLQSQGLNGQTPQVSQGYGGYAMENR
jgi:hypothetical protein